MIVAEWPADGGRPFGAIDPENARSWSASFQAIDGLHAPRTAFIHLLIGA